jgi:rod shape-determining protein MreD
MFHVKQASVPLGAEVPLVYSPCRPPHRHAVVRVGRGTQISYIGLLLAVLVGILHAAVAPVIAIGDVHPNVVLVAVVAVTVVRGFGQGVAWAFTAGLTANLLTLEPLGSIPLGLLVVSAAAAGGARLFGRLSWAYPVAAVALGSLVVDLISLAVLLMIDQPIAGDLPVQRLVAAAILNAGIAAIVILPARVLIERAGLTEKPAW